MTNITITTNRLTSSSKLDSSAAFGGSPRPILLGRMDVSMVADGTDLKGSLATTANWAFDHGNSTIKKYTEGGQAYVRAVYNNDFNINVGSWPAIKFLFSGGESPQEFYFQFYARRDGSVPAGCKFVKCYGIVGGDGNCANTTFNNGYGTSYIGSIAYGDGTGLTNDNAEALFYEAGHFYETNLRPSFNTVQSGRYPSVAGNILPRTFAHGGEWTDANWGDGTQWHKFQMRVRQNTGTSSTDETNDGLYEVWVDNVLRCAGYNIMNRNPINRRFYQIEFMSYMQGVVGFTLEMKNITVSTGGWID